MPEQIMQTTSPKPTLCTTPYYVLDLSNSSQKALKRSKRQLVKSASTWFLIWAKIHYFSIPFQHFCKYFINPASFRLIRRPRVDQEWTESVFYCRFPHSQRDIFTNKLKINSRYCSYLDGYNLSRNEQRNNQKFKKVTRCKFISRKATILLEK